MEHRQCTHESFGLFANSGQPVLCHLHVGADIAVAKHRTLRGAGGSGSIKDECDVVRGQRRLWFQVFTSAADRAVEKHAVRDRVIGFCSEHLALFTHRR